MGTTMTWWNNELIDNELEINDMKSKDKQCADSKNSGIANVVDGKGVQHAKPAKIVGNQSGKAVPPTNSHTR